MTDAPRNGADAGSDEARWRRLVQQFSGTGSAAPVWDALDLVLDTDRYLNMGYSPWYLPHAVGSSQLRLGRYLGRAVALELGYTAGARLLDVGCGRGGPTVALSRRYGFDATGVDLVGHNVALARENAATAGVDADFCIGDARRLPVATDAVDACVVVDAAQYVADLEGMYAELARVTRPGGAVAVSDLVVSDCGPLDPDDRAAVEAFADAWDMAVPRPLADTRAAAADAELRVRRVEDVTANSVGRFGFWADLFLALADTPLGCAAERLLAVADVDLRAVEAQVAATRPALGHLRHAVVVARA